MTCIRPAGVAIRMTVVAGAAVAALIAVENRSLAQERRILSPPGHSAVQVGGTFDPVQYGYLGGSWIDVYYGRPLKRGRDLFGPPDWAVMLNDGAPVWRAGANQSTRLVTEAPLIIGGTRVEPGEYTLFIDLSDDGWTFIVSTWPAQATYDYENKDALFGAFDYTADRDVLRAPMELRTLPVAFDQLSWQFLDMHRDGGRLALIWDTKLRRCRSPSRIDDALRPWCRQYAGGAGASPPDGPIIAP